MPQHGVDVLFTNATVLTMNARKEIFERGTVAIKDEKIVAIGDHSLAETMQAREVVDLEGDILMPGFVNAHTHMSMIVFRSLADDVANRLEAYIFPLEKRMVSPEMVTIGARLGAIEMIKSGVTTCADMYYFEECVAEVVDALGMRAVLGQTVINFPVADARAPQEGIALASRLIERYQGHDRIIPAFAPHAPYSTTPGILQEIHRLSADYRVPVLMHVAEMTKEVEAARHEGQTTPVGALARLGVLDERLVAAHAIFVSDEDLRLLKDHQVGISHNISANIKSARGVAPALKMFEQGVRVGLGTDGPMSRNSLSVIDELELVAKVHKLANQDRTVMPPERVVEMATMGGARALHLEDRIGSIEAGKLADLIVVSTHDVNMVPLYNPYSALVYSANASNVRHAMIHGRLVLRDRQMLTADEAAARQTVIDFSHEVRKTVLNLGETIR